MTKLLEKAFEEASRLPEVDQNALAKWVLDELHSERAWEKAFAESDDALEKLADEVRAWEKERNAIGATVRWRFNKNDARVKLQRHYFNLQN